MTTLGQYGTVILVQELMKIYTDNRRDLIFTEMDLLTEDFRDHFRLSKENPEEHKPATSGGARAFQSETRFDMEEELCLILETIYTSVPIVPVDNKSGSYHSLSTEESDFTSTPRQVSFYKSSFNILTIGRSFT